MATSPGCFVSFLCLTAILKLVVAQIELIPEVMSEEGLVKGEVRKSRVGKEFYRFLGIPYAEPPMRFKLSKPKEPWEGLHDGTKHGKKCPQLLPGDFGSFTGFEGEEDCLHLSVYTPYSTEGGALLPVMVWIHGGGFMILAESDFEGDYFMDEDVVVVTVNYRLGALGFLYFEDGLIPGNLGLKDQNLALKWVQRNIHHFGGDPKKVTIFGESAGASAVHFHMLSTMSKGLFHRAIAQSGTAIAPWSISERPRKTALEFASRLKCPVDNTTKTLECLKNMSTQDLVNEQTTAVWGPLVYYKWAPVVEKHEGLNVSKAFMSRKPQHILDDGSVPNKVPFITGLMKNEGAMIFSALILGDDDLTMDLNKNWNNIAPKAFYYAKPEDSMQKERDLVSTKIRDFYFQGLNVAQDTEQRLTDIFSDRYFSCDLVKTLIAHSHLQPTYAYIYTFYGGYSVLHMTGYENFDPPTHSDDVPMLLRFTYKYDVSQQEAKFSKAITKLWASFAKNGAPTATWGPATEWKPIPAKATSVKWYKLDNATAVIPDPFQERCAFWESLQSNELTQMY